MKFELTLPPVLNKAYGITNTRKGRPYTYKKTETKGWQRDARLEIYQQVGKVPMLTDDVVVNIELHLKFNRDIDSSHKILLDTLEYAQIIKNDKQIIELNTKKFYPSKKPRMIVYVDSKAI